MPVLLLNLTLTMINFKEMRRRRVVQARLGETPSTESISGKKVAGGQALRWKEAWGRVLAHLLQSVQALPLLLLLHGAWVESARAGEWLHLPLDIVQLDLGLRLGRGRGAGNHCPCGSPTPVSIPVRSDTTS